MPKSNVACLAGPLLAVLGSLAPAGASAWDMQGKKQVELRTRDGATIPIGTVTFKPDGEKTKFALALDLKDFRDHFLSMREFKCLEGPELQCHVPYPYGNPRTVSGSDLSWLEHSLIFFFKAPADYGAKLSNGLYYAMKLTDAGIIGTPKSVDLNDIAAPPNEPNTPPFGPDARTDIEPRTRWIETLIIH
ncbi:hypothetical protein [Methylobacterium sp. C25]|uniref:hypothetical protein n=1 Tax=Methylobacterium sp. C25 TaxID=2721622 RepID=UPI001F455E70|nr:hypothetical protein [Methylobacterium sp. C25]